MKAPLGAPSLAAALGQWNLSGESRFDLKSDYGGGRDIHLIIALPEAVNQALPQPQYK